MLQNRQIVELNALLNTLIRKLHIFDREEKICCGVTVPQSYTIQAIKDHKNPTIGELSEIVGVKISTMTRILNVLVRDKIAERVTQPQDRRKVAIKLTLKGKELSQKIEKCFLSKAELILDRLTKAEQKSVLTGMGLINSVLSKLKTCC